MEGMGVYRINGNLAVARAIGDRSERPFVSSEFACFFFKFWVRLCVGGGPVGGSLCDQPSSKTHTTQTCKRNPYTVNRNRNQHTHPTPPLYFVMTQARWTWPSSRWRRATSSSCWPRTGSGTSCPARRRSRWVCVGAGVCLTDFLLPPWDGACHVMPCDPPSIHEHMLTCTTPH